MKLLFAGTPEAAVPSLRALVAAGHDVVAVATNPDAPRGRGRRLTPSPVALAAEELGIEVLKPSRAREPWFVTRVNEIAPDAAPVVAWGSLIPDSLLDVPRHGWINVHFSLLPAYRGAAPVQRAIMAGDTETGITTFRIIHDLDAGPVFSQVTTSIDSDRTESAGELLQRLAIQGAAVLVDTLADIEAGKLPVAQRTQGASLAPKLSVAEVRLDWGSASATQLANVVRAANPNPGAWTTFAGQRLKVLRADATSGFVAGGGAATKPGLAYPLKGAVVVCAKQGVLTLRTVQPEGKKPMNAGDWARGARLEQGARFD